MKMQSEKTYTLILNLSEAEILKDYCTWLMEISDKLPMKLNSSHALTFLKEYTDMWSNLQH